MAKKCINTTIKIELYLGKEIRSAYASRHWKVTAVAHCEVMGEGLPEATWKVLTFVTESRWLWLRTHAVTSKLVHVCILCIPMWLISAGYGVLHFLVFLSCISKHKFRLCSNYFLNIFNALGQICIFKIRV